MPIPDLLWELSIGDQKTGDVVGVEETDEAVDFRVHDWLAHQRESAVFDFQALLVALGLYSGDTWKNKCFLFLISSQTIKGKVLHVETYCISKHCKI